MDENQAQSSSLGIHPGIPAGISDESKYDAGLNPEAIRYAQIDNAALA
jgi:hypothetical protein